MSSSSIDLQEQMHRLEHEKQAALEAKAVVEIAINERKRELLTLKDGLEKARVNCSRLDAEYRIAKDEYFTALREGR
ncbi:MAG: hypothetical protein WC734_06030 [Patescibacteria group bacterium]|jgi:hypothetical protein